MCGAFLAFQDTRHSGCLRNRKRYSFFIDRQQYIFQRLPDMVATPILSPLYLCFPSSLGMLTRLGGECRSITIITGRFYTNKTSPWTPLRRLQHFNAALAIYACRKLCRRRSRGGLSMQIRRDALVCDPSILPRI